MIIASSWPRQRTFLRALSALRSAACPVSRRPNAAVTQPQASSTVPAALIRSMTVSSTSV